MIDKEALKQSFNSDDNILIAVSGGPDSMALLDLLNSIKDDIPISISVAHVNYHLRKESDIETDGVEKYCLEHNIPFYRKDADPKTLQSSRKSTEEWARDLRYDYFSELIEKYGFTKLLTAHHMDDQVETILMRLLRGTGPNGLTGISKESIRDGYTILRPFLSENKVDLRQYCVENNIEFFTDSSNEESKYSRNFIRNEVLPLLESQYPKLKKNVTALTDLLVDENQVIYDIVENLLNQYTIPEEYGVRFEPALFKDFNLILKQNGLGYLSEASQGFILSEMIRKVIDSVSGLKDFSKEHIKQILEFFHSGSSGSLELPNHVLVLKSGTAYLITRTDLLPKPFGEYSISVKINQLGIKSFLFPKERKILKVKTGKAQDFPEHFKSPNKVLLNLKNVSNGSLLFRKRREDDEVFLSGMSGRKKLSRYMIDKKIPKFLRDSLPVLAEGNKIIWIPGYYIHRDYFVHSPEDDVVELVYQDL